VEDRELVKQLVDEFERRLSALAPIDESKEHNLLSAVVDEQVARELGFAVINGGPLDGVKVSPDLARKAKARHAYLLAVCDKERAQRLDTLDAEGLLDGDE